MARILRSIFWLTLLLAASVTLVASGVSIFRYWTWKDIAVSVKQVTRPEKNGEAKDLERRFTTAPHHQDGSTITRFPYTYEWSLGPGEEFVADPAPSYEGIGDGRGWSTLDPGHNPDHERGRFELSEDRRTLKLLYQVWGNSFDVVIRARIKTPKPGQPITTEEVARLEFGDPREFTFGKEAKSWEIGATLPNFSRVSASSFSNAEGIKIHDVTTDSEGSRVIIEIEKGSAFPTWVLSFLGILFVPLVVGTIGEMMKGATKAEAFEVEETNETGY